MTSCRRPDCNSAPRKFVSHRVKKISLSIMAYLPPYPSLCRRCQRHRYELATSCFTDAHRTQNLAETLDFCGLHAFEDVTYPGSLFFVNGLEASDFERPWCVKIDRSRARRQAPYRAAEYPLLIPAQFQPDVSEACRQPASHKIWGSENASRRPIDSFF
jgi:hypothetical protein